jgi:adenylate cyclase
MPRLLIERPGHPPQVFELPEGRTVHAGRADSNEMVLPDSNVSRQHARFTPLGSGRWQVADLGSANGVLVNNSFISERELKHNDVVAIGSYTMRFEALETKDLRLQAGTDLPSRLTLVMSRKEVELALGQQFTPTPEPGAPRGAPPPGVPERRVESDQRLRALERENRLLTLLYQVSRALAELATVDDVVARVLELVLQVEGVQRGYAMLLDEKGDFLPAVIRYRDRADSTSAPQMILSSSIIRRVMEGGEPILVQDAEADARFAASESLMLSGMQSAMCAPLRSQQKNFGLLYVDNLSKRGMFTQEDLNVFAVIAAQAGLAIDRVRAKKEIAQQIIHRNVLERFLSPSIARKVASEPANFRLGGENQKVTVLFADIRGFTPMAESLPPEKAVEVLNRFFEAMTALIFEREGTLDKYLGDGLMALFGAPFSTGQDAYNAVRTAVDMQGAVAEMNRETGHAPLHIGIGINTGPAVVGTMGTAKNWNYTAIGDTVNTASRLTALAEPDQILVSAATFAEVASSFPARELPPVQVKGRVAPVSVHSILWREFSQ